MIMLANFITAANIVVLSLAGATPWQSHHVKSPVPGHAPLIERRSFGTQRLGSVTPWERRPLVLPFLQGATSERHPSKIGAVSPVAPYTSSHGVSVFNKNQLAIVPEDGYTPPYASTELQALDSCPGDDNVKCNYDSDHRICAQLLDMEGKPLNWGDQSIQHLNIRNGGANMCINMSMTASLIQKVGCENVHIRCDATDIGYVTARNWWAYGRWGLSLAPAVNCLQKICAPGMSATQSNGFLGNWEMMGLSGKASLEDPVSALATQNEKAMKLAYQQCEDVTKTFSKTFYIGTGLMPPAARKHAWAIYTWCRRTDDIVDSPQAMLNPDVLDSDLEEWVRRLDEIWKQRPMDLYDLAMADTVRAYPTLDIQPFQDMIDGMIMDVPGHTKGKTRYQTFDELYVYCYRVAGTVGMMMLPILGTADGVTEEEAKAPAIALGIALQLTNILRDVGEDLKRGRIYLPLDELRQFGLTEEDLFAGKVTEKYKKFLKFQIARARDYYQEAARGIPMLAPDARFAVRGSMDLYGRILDKIEENDYDNFNKRAYTTGLEKLGILPGSWMKSMQKYGELDPAVSLDSSPNGAAVWSANSLVLVMAGVALGAVVATAMVLRHRRLPDCAEPILA